MKIKKTTEPEPDQYILSFDPGGTTGMCLIRYNKKELSLSLLAQISDGHMGFYDNLVGVPGGYDTPVTLVSEKWVEHEVKGADRTPLVIEGIQYAFWPDQVVYQTPSMKHMISDDDLKEIGVWTEGKPHQMDALRHALVFLRNQLHQPTLEMLSEGQQMPQDGDEGAQQAEVGAGEGQRGEQGQGEGEGQGQGEGQGGEGQEGQGQGQGEGQDGSNGNQEGQGQGHGDPNQDQGPGQGSLATFLIQLSDGKVDDGDALVQLAKDIYNRERDLDGAFAGYQADPNESRTVMIDQDF